MLSTNKINEPFLFKKIDQLVQADLNGPLSISKEEKDFIWQRFTDRFNEWLKIFHNVETANLKNLQENIHKWNETMDTQKKIKFEYGLYSWELYAYVGGDNKVFDEKNNFKYPYSAAMRFHNRLAKVFNDLGMWGRLYSFVHPHTLVYALRLRSLYYFNRRDNKKKESFDGIKNYYSKPYHLPVENTMDSWFFAVSECLYFALGGYSYLSKFDLTENCNSHLYIKAMEYMRNAIDAGYGCSLIWGDVLMVFPEVKLKYNANFQIHCDVGPAAGDYNGGFGYWLNGVRVDEKVVTKPETITIKQILKQSNIEVKRIMIEKYGMEKFVKDIGAKVIDSVEYDGKEHSLLRINLKENEPWMLVKVVCHSTNRNYFLRVPPHMTNVKVAIAWTFNMSADEYYPLKES